MSATVVGEKRQTTLPLDVVEAAGIRANDQIEWRFENGEIRGRKLEPKVTTVTRKLIRRGKYLMMDTSGLKIEPSDIATAVREERDR